MDRVRPLLLALLALLGPAACAGSAATGRPPGEGAAAVSQAQGCPGPDRRGHPITLVLRDEAGETSSTRIEHAGDGVDRHVVELPGLGQAWQEMAHGLYPLRTEDPFGTITFRWTPDPAPLPAVEGTVVVNDAVITSSERADGWLHQEITVGPRRLIRVASCPIEAIRLTVRTTGNGAATVRELWFDPSLRLQLGESMTMTAKDGTRTTIRTEAVGFE